MAVWDRHRIRANRKPAFARQSGLAEAAYTTRRPALPPGLQRCCWSDHCYDRKGGAWVLAAFCRALAALSSQGEGAAGWLSAEVLCGSALLPANLTAYCIERAMAEAAYLGTAVLVRKEVFGGVVFVAPAFNVYRHRPDPQPFVLPVGRHDDHIIRCLRRRALLPR